MHKIFGILICLLLLSTIIPIGTNADLSYDPLDGGWLEEIDGVTIIHVSGSHYEMGYQTGHLLKDKIEQNYKILLDSASTDLLDEILVLWNDIRVFTTPEIYIEEMQGLADGIGRSFEQVAVFSIGLPEFILNYGCSEIVAWGPATNNGELYHYYSCDIPKMIKIPETGTYIHDNQVLMIRDPSDCYASITLIIPGCIGYNAGFNEKAISIAAESSPSSDKTDYAISPMLHKQLVLETASSADEAIDMLIENQTGGVNVHIGDGNIPIGYVCELTANSHYIGTWNDSTEDTPPFWQIDHVLRRKNMFINSFTASTQREFYNPKAYFLLGMIRGVIPWFNPWRYYKTISEEIENIWGNMDINSMIDIARSVYRGKTDSYLNFLHMIGRENFCSYYQWVSCPKTGDILFSFAEDRQYAQYGDVHYFNFYDLLNSEPP
jgi:hypothetical protein